MARPSKKKIMLSPIENVETNNVVNETSDIDVSSENVITDNLVASPTVESIIENDSEINDLEKISDEYDKKIEELTNDFNEQIRSKQCEIDHLSCVVNDLMNENIKLRGDTRDNIVSNTELDILKRQIEELQNENDDLILRNSELMFDNARLEASIKEVEKKVTEKPKEDTMTIKRSVTSTRPVQTYNRKPNRTAYISNNGYVGWN